MNIAVIGGGISGLSAAHRLTELLPHARLMIYEATGRLGGVLETARRDGYLVERSADSFITKYPWATDLCERLGIGDQLVPTDESRRRALVVHDGKLACVPAGFVLMTPNRRWPILTTPILSWPGKLRVLAEPWMPRRPGDQEGDESVGSFARRRLGDEAYERLVQPLLGGIHTADADHLSLAATFPEYIAQEQFHGHIQRNAATKSDSGARYGMFVSPREGLSQLVRALADRLPTDAIRLSTSVTEVRRSGNQWQIMLNGGALETADAVIVAVPAPSAAKLLSNIDAALSQELAAIQYAGCAIVCLAYRRDQFGVAPDGFGFVVPKVERRQILAGSYASEKFAGRAPSGEILVRVFIGGALAPELATRPDDELRSIAERELAELLQMSGKPIWTDIARWPSSMPQYEVGHLQRVAAIDARIATLPGLALAGNAYRGVGIPQCIHSGETAANTVFTRLSQ
ncbi:MAG: protoporphyrinogen oxidase [Pirellulales bacterium]